MLFENCEIMVNKEITPGIFELFIRSRNMADKIEPGQFLHIKPATGGDPLLRRPISVCKVDRKYGLITLVYHVVGKGTKELSRLTPRQQIDVMGPLGKGFPIESGKKCAVIGGGIGVAPLLELTARLDNCDAYLGFRNNPYLMDEFRKHCQSVYIATEDGSCGSKGYVTDLLAANIDQYDVIYTCGPKVMMKKVKELCAEKSILCYVSIEERMGCGIGACLVCACKIAEKEGNWHYKKACTDGPVFRAEEVLFDE